MIKNFIYLDIDKLYSMSSQIFEGITEYIVGESASEVERSEAQKGPVGSGRVMGDILRHNDKKSEKRFLHDYSYSLFEEKLLKDGKILDLTDKENYENFKRLLTNKPFVKGKNPDPEGQALG